MCITICFFFLPRRERRGGPKLKPRKKGKLWKKIPALEGGGQKEFPPQPFEGERFLSASTARAEGTGLSDGRYRIRRFSKCLFRMFYLWEGERGGAKKRCAGSQPWKYREEGGIRLLCIQATIVSSSSFPLSPLLSPPHLLYLGRETRGGKRCLAIIISFRERRRWKKGRKAFYPFFSCLKTRDPTFYAE